MTARHFTALGTASQAPTRLRQHNSYALRWDEQLVLFDPGEGTQRQCLVAGLSIARATAVFVTHFHGDHCLGLPGVIQRRALDNRGSAEPRPPLPIVYPAEGQEFFERLRWASEFHDTSNIEPVPVGAEGPVLDLSPELTVSARRLNHRIPTYGYRLDEADAVRLDPDALAARGIEGPDVGRLVADGRLETEAGTVGLAEVSHMRPGQSLAFVMDTSLCDGAAHLADGVDLLVCESTFLDRDAELAARFHHLTAGQAARLAVATGARRLVLTHFSARYPDNEVFAAEASAIHDDVVVADDLMTIDVPPRRS